MSTATSDTSDKVSADEETGAPPIFGSDDVACGEDDGDGKVVGSAELGNMDNFGALKEAGKGRARGLAPTCACISKTSFLFSSAAR